MLWEITHCPLKGDLNNTPERIIIPVAGVRGLRSEVTSLINPVPGDSELAWQLLAFDKHLSYSNDTFL